MKLKTKISIILIAFALICANVDSRKVKTKKEGDPKKIFPEIGYLFIRNYAENKQAAEKEIKKIKSMRLDRSCYSSILPVKDMESIVSIKSSKAIEQFKEKLSLFKQTLSQQDAENVTTGVARSSKKKIKQMLEKNIKYKEDYKKFALTTIGWFSGSYPSSEIRSKFSSLVDQIPILKNALENVNNQFHQDFFRSLYSSFIDFQNSIAFLIDCTHFHSYENFDKMLLHNIKDITEIKIETEINYFIENMLDSPDINNNVLIVKDILANSGENKEENNLKIIMNILESDYLDGLLKKANSKK